jgi:regulator of protease activity HflC (stomatin/prohibitin superfamily)
MNEALAWIGQIAEWFGQFIPRWVIITTTHGAVKWVRGHKVKSLGPGIHWYWPATTQLNQFPIVRQGSILEPQTIVTRDGVTVAVTAVIVYEVEDLEALFTQTQDADNTISEICLTAAQDVLTGMGWDEIRDTGVEAVWGSGGEAHPQRPRALQGLPHPRARRSG